MEKVYLVEHRTHEKGSTDINTVVATIVSSLDNAIKFMKENTDFDDGEKWWWAVYSMIVDEDTDLDELYLYNKKVERIYWQNKFYDRPVELGLVYEFDLNFGDYNYLGDYVFRGMLVNTENEALTDFRRS